MIFSSLTEEKKQSCPVQLYILYILYVYISLHIYMFTAVLMALLLNQIIFIVAFS